MPVMGQDIVMSNGSVSTCGGNFYDSGNDTAAYSSNENYILTVCSDVPGKCVSLNFSFFNIENNFDFLYVYNGPSVTSPLLGTFTGSTSPGIITATSGCLTIKFVSDYTVNNDGWNAVISCSTCPVNGCPTCSGGAPPLNDACSGAQNLGALATPFPCPGGQGQPLVFNTTNICATAEIPYNALQNCTPVGNMAVPASDVWYKFSITGPILNVTINGMITPEVGLYSGSSCSNLVPRGCAIGGGGLLNTSFSGLAPGQYYLRVSGGTLTDQCNFTVTLKNNLDCQGCVSQSLLTVNPLPQNGIYLAGQTVNFCLQISDFTATSANWLHAVIPSLGPGWDISTLVASPPASCSGNGSWNWYSQPVTSLANGFTTGPGFFYETAAGSPNGVADNDPGNNFGDNFLNGCAWNFCFSITTKDQGNCVNGENLNVFFETYSDGETGAWTSTACAADPTNDFFASLACCIPPGVTVTNALCNGQTGSAIGTGLGSGPWTFVWKNSTGNIIRQVISSGTDQIINIAPGSYTLSTIDVFGCETSTAFSVTEPQILSATIQIIHTKCALNNGKVIVNATGGTAPYKYSSNNGVSFQASNVLGGLTPGTYSIVVEDANGCTWTASATIAPSTFPVITNITSQDVTCSNGEDGMISISASGGATPYSYSINGGQTYQSGAQFNNLVIGTYQVVVKDLKGCTATSIITITQPDPIIFQTIIQNATCGNTDGSISVNVANGGSGTLSYSIDMGQTFQLSNTFNLLGAGMYFVQVTDSTGCIASDTAVVNNLNAPSINNVSVTNLTCFNSSDGSLVISANGGTGTLQFSIDSGATFYNTNTFNNLPGGVYFVIVRDQSNCRSNQVVVITEPLKIVISGQIFKTTCGLNNGIAVFSVANGLGVPPFEYSIDMGITWQSSGTFSNLPPGIFVVSVRDANGCTVAHATSVVGSTTPVVTSYNITNALCSNTVTGAADIIITGGIAPIEYSIDGGATFSTAGSFSPLAAGTYNVVVKDDEGCSTTSSFIITEPSPVVLSASSLNARCGLINGSITMNASGGTTPFVYSIDGGVTFDSSNVFDGLTAGNYKVVAKDVNGCIEAAIITINEAPGPRITDTLTTPQICDGMANGSISLTAAGGSGVLLYSIDSGNTFFTSSNFLNLFSGNYFIYVLDTNGCRDSATASVGIYNSPVINQSVITDISCTGFSNGSISINASGGTGQLFYSIDGGANLFSSNNFDSLAQGVYYIVVSDSNNCLVIDTVNVSEPAPLTIANLTIPEKCDRNDGSVAISVTGGTANYLFSINNSLFIADSVFTSLDSGAYSILVTDANGCSDSVIAFVSFLSAPAINMVSSTDELCNTSDDGTITINASGGSGTLSYSNDNGLAFQSSNVFDSLAAGNYSIIISDTNGCMADTIVAINQPLPLVLSYQTVPANCSFNNGSIHINASGGVGPLTYSINNSGVFSADTSFINLVSGNYVVTVKDSLGCTKDFNTIVGNLNGPSIQSVNTTDLLCNSISTGSIVINATGGSGALTYSIDNGMTFQSSNIFSNLPASTYSIVVEDTAHCRFADSTDILQPDPIVINQQVINAACGQSNGEITLSVTGGTVPYLYSVDSINYQSSPVFVNLLAGTYTVVVKDFNNCIAVNTVVVNNLLAPVINSVSQKNLTCFHNQTGEINIAASGGTGNLNYSIDNGTTYQSSNIFTALSAGLYNIIVQDQNNCIANSPLQITEPDSLMLNASVLNETCSNQNGNISVNAIGGTLPYLFSIDSGLVFSTQANYASMNNGIYNIAVKDSNGCKTIHQASITDLAGPQISNYVSTDVNCYGGNDGSISITAAGGNGTLIYSLDTNQQQNNLFINLSQGNYIVQVTDTNNCRDTIHITISQPAILSASSSQTNPNCFGSSDGVVNVVAAGGTPNYSIQWSNGVTNNFSLAGLIQGTYYFTITDDHLCALSDSVSLTQPLDIVITHTSNNGSCAGSANGSASVTVTGGTAAYSYSWLPLVSNSNFANNLAAGTYTVTVSDAHGCTKNHSIIITAPAPVVAQLQVNDVNCFGGNDGSIIVIPNGGNAPYSYSWSNGNINSNTANSLTAGNYAVMITDLNGCTLQKTATVTSPDEIIVNAIVSNVSCNGYSNGAVNLNASGGVSPYVFSWSNGSVQSSAINLSAGTYSVTVTDAHGCTKQISYSVTEPTPVVVSVNPVDTLCIGQQSTLTCNASGGAGSYIYNWSTGQNTQAIQVTPVITSIYSVQATDTNGCLSNTGTSYVFVHPPLQIAVSPGDTICQKESAVISVVPSGGNGGPYFYSWNPVNAASQQVTVHPDTTTTYMASVSDHCTAPDATGFVTIKVNPLPVVNFTTVPAEGCQPLTVNFFDQTITPQGSVYNWNLGDDSPHQSVANPVHEYTLSGSYTVTLTVTTPANCADLFTMPGAVNVYPLPEAAFSLDPEKASIFNPQISFKDESILAAAWKWDFGDGSGSSVLQHPVYMYSDTGTFKVQLIVSTGHLCLDTAWNEVTINSEFTFYVPNAFTPNGDGKNDFFFASGFDIRDFEIFIFNRWGGKVFEGNKLNSKWNGKQDNTGLDSPEGVYVYKIQTRDLRDKPHAFEGRVSLIR